MQVRIRKASWVEGFEVMWQPAEKPSRWYGVQYGNIGHEDGEARRDALNAVYQGLTVVCRAAYDRKTHRLTILPAKVM